MTKELITGNNEARVIKRIYGDGQERYWVQLSTNGFPWSDYRVFNNRAGAVFAKNEWLLGKAQDHVVSEEVID